jgi:hypothetical protein
MLIRTFPGCGHITISTPIGVLSNIIWAALLGSASSILFAAAGLTDIAVGYFPGIFYGCLGGLMFARFALKDKEQRTLYHKTFEHILKHLPSRQTSKGRFLRAFFFGCEWWARLVRVQLNFASRDRLTAAMHAIAHFNKAATDSARMHRYFLLSDAFLTHAPPAVL